MSKMSTELTRHALNGATMGTRWSALFFAEPDFDPAPTRAALQAAVDGVDGQMSTWNPGSDLMQLNAAPVGEWVTVPARLAEVLRLGLEIGRASGGAFDIGMGDAVTAWGFGPGDAAPDGIRAAMTASRRPAHEVLEMDDARVRKAAVLKLDLNGIAKG
ncbi:MAG: ApbE-like lipoprotein [Xanthobacteraceae bacterium]|nr:MAG: ApbE-like lipoprotein [Xanthobacteraceae bacterium]